MKDALKKELKMMSLQDLNLTSEAVLSIPRTKTYGGDVKLMSCTKVEVRGRLWEDG